MRGFRANCRVRQGLALALQPPENAVYVAYTPTVFAFVVGRYFEQVGYKVPTTPASFSLTVRCPFGSVVASLDHQGERAGR